MKADRLAPRVVVLVLLASCVPAAAQENANVAGDWTLTIRDPLSINDEVPLTLEQDGTDLTGTAHDSIVAGTVAGRRISMFYEVDTFQVGRITLAFTGTVNDSGDSMRGDVAFGRYAAGTWTAVRRAALGTSLNSPVKSGAFRASLHGSLDGMTPAMALGDRRHVLGDRPADALTPPGGASTYLPEPRVPPVAGHHRAAARHHGPPDVCGVRRAVQAETLRIVRLVLPGRLG